MTRTSWSRSRYAFVGTGPATIVVVANGIASSSVSLTVK
jgi:hypothetical protein